MSAFQAAARPLIDRLIRQADQEMSQLSFLIDPSEEAPVVCTFGQPSAHLRLDLDHLGAAFAKALWALPFANLIEARVEVHFDGQDLGQCDLTFSETCWQTDLTKAMDNLDTLERRLLEIASQAPDEHAPAPYAITLDGLSGIEIVHQNAGSPRQALMLYAAVQKPDGDIIDGADRVAGVYRQCAPEYWQIPPR